MFIEIESKNEGVLLLKIREHPHKHPLNAEKPLSKNAAYVVGTDLQQNLSPVVLGGLERKG